MFRSTGMICGMALALALLAGCRHPCGYVDTWSRVVPNDTGEHLSMQTPAQPIALMKSLTVENAVIEIRVEKAQVASCAATRELYGKQAYVPWRWYVPLLKPVAAVTLIIPFWTAGNDPHAHSGGNWSGGDYFRDVIAWFNPCSGVPIAGRKLDPQERLISTRVVETVVSETRLPDAGRHVALMLDFRQIAEAVTDADGRATFNLAPHLTQDLAGEDHVLRFTLPGANAGENPAIYARALDQTALKEYLDAHSAAVPKPGGK